MTSTRLRFLEDEDDDMIVLLATMNEIRTVDAARPRVNREHQSLFSYSLGSFERRSRYQRSQRSCNKIEEAKKQLKKEPGRIIISHIRGEAKYDDVVLDAEECKITNGSEGEDLIRVVYENVDFAREDTRLLLNGDPLCPDMALRYQRVKIQEGVILELDLAPKRITPALMAKFQLEVSQEPCIISGEDDETAYRAKMPCNHCISADALAKHITVQMSKQEHEIRCPHVCCKTVWEWNMCMEIAQFTNEERVNLEKQINNVALQQTTNIKKCPRCFEYIMIGEGDLRNSDKVICHCGCRFCWHCGTKWKMTFRNRCGNKECPSRVRRANELLANCEPKKIGKVQGVPKWRACPQCYTMIEHKEACKHMKCTEKTCKTEFCFVCLAVKTRGQWECGSYEDACSVAPRQMVPS